MAVIGSAILILLAATCTGSEIGGPSTDVGGADDGCVVRYFLGVALPLVNIAHVVGLLLFESAGYRGLFARFFAWTSLIGTPAAIIISLLVH